MHTVVAKPIGVMDASYARQRSRKRHLKFRFRVRAALVAQAVRRHLPDGHVALLEVGAAEGRTLAAMARALGPGRYVGVEFDPTLIHAGPELPPNVSLIVGDAMKLPPQLDRSSFDVVSMLALLEHLLDPAAALREARRVLRPGGIIVCTCPHPGWDALAGRLGLVANEHHVGRLGRNELRALVAAAGFEILEADRFMWAPVAVLPYARVPVSPAWSLAVDACVRRVLLLRGMMVNGYVVGRRPAKPLPGEQA